MQDRSKKNALSLRASEWVLAGSLVLILLSLFAVAKIQVWQLSRGTTANPVVLVVVGIEGFVERPGVYEVALGTPLGEVLRKAHPKRFADLREIDLKSPVLHSTLLKIESLRSLKIHITGAVTTCETIEVMPGTRICQLKQKISLSKEADLAFFKKQRLLADGEVLNIPRKEFFKNS